MAGVTINQEESAGSVFGVFTLLIPKRDTDIFLDRLVLIKKSGNDEVFYSSHKEDSKVPGYEVI
jgi:hypothetical protein